MSPTNLNANDGVGDASTDNLNATFVKRARTRAMRIIPLSSLFGGYSLVESPWFTANYPVGMPFEVNYDFTPSYVVMPCTVGSGNVQVAIYTLSRTGDHSFDGVRVVDSGVIPCPTVGDYLSNTIKIPFVSPATLPPGNYILGFWTDNTTINVAHYLSNAVVRAGVAIDVGGASGSGLAAAFTGQSHSGRSVLATIEGSIPLA